MPHIIAFPAPRIALADTELSADARRQRRRKRTADDDGEGEEMAEDSDEREMLKKKKMRECPVPKPRRMIEVWGIGKGHREGFPLDVPLEVERREMERRRQED